MSADPSASSASSAAAAAPSPAPAAASASSLLSPSPAAASPALSALLQKSPALSAIKALAPLPPSNDTNDAAAAEAAAAAAPPQLCLADGEADESAGAAAAPQHELHQRWVFWHDVSDGKPKEWGQSLVKLYEFNTVENFWGLLNNICKPSALPIKSDYHLFRYGIKPEWEDPQNRGGGKWVWELKRDEQLDQGWMHTLLFMIGEHFSDEAEVLGTVISLRKGRNKLALWTRSSQDRTLLMRVGTEWKRALQLPQAVQISFVSHSTTMKAGGKNNFDLKPQYTV